MVKGRQLALDLPFRAALGRDSFFVTPCNEEALAYIERWPDWPGPLTVICGPSGCGKSHLAAVWEKQVGAMSVYHEDVESVVPQVGPQNCCFVVNLVDGISDEEAFLHLFNRVAEENGSIVLTTIVPPARWKFKLADLGSRLRAAPVLNIGRVDDELLEAVLVKLFADRQVRVEPGVVTYLLRRMDRNIGAAQSLVAQLDKMALSDKRTISVPFARSVMNASQSV